MGDFNLKRNSMITERNGNKVTLYDSIRRASQNNNVLKSYLTANFSALSATEQIKNIAFFNEERILILDSTGTYSKDLHPTLILLTQSPKINLDRMLQVLKPQIVVADASNYKTIQNHWKVSCESKKSLSRY
jgi:competence protein ComEC